MVTSVTQNHGKKIAVIENEVRDSTDPETWLERVLSARVRANSLARSVSTMRSSSKNSTPRKRSLR